MSPPAVRGESVRTAPRLRWQMIAEVFKLYRSEGIVNDTERYKLQQSRIGQANTILDLASDLPPSSQASRLGCSLLPSRIFGVQRFRLHRDDRG